MAVLAAELPFALGSEPAIDYPATRIRFADRVLRACPPWLRRTRGAKFMAALAEPLDDLVDRAVEGLRLRFPGELNEEALPYLGRDRRILRGPGESAAAYAVRLRRWWGDHRRRGGPYALLEQLAAFWSATPQQIDLLYHSGTRFVLAASGTITRDAIAWDPDGDPTKWAQIWLFYYAPSDPGVLTFEEVEAYRALVRTWNAGHVLPAHVWLLWPGAELWDYPSGTWDDDPLAVWSTAGPQDIGALYPSGGP